MQNEHFSRLLFLFYFSLTRVEDVDCVQEGGYPCLLFL